MSRSVIRSESEIRISNIEIKATRKATPGKRTHTKSSDETEMTCYAYFARSALGVQGVFASLLRG
ncbi:MAG: hypothetical protein DMF36_01605 [Verrucomicrobia bacterium]|nr:MAG: hypothetical protein AUG81_01330 [Verrucomicrobia bacterium 13_1_20CM_4_54_11]OLE13424.1 MAG: hypothetical protein AUG52_00855 [Verrucomicrobia bacterium 13_1_20CM_3_54_17]PYL40931.1 MAG: hypothetical protein DMF36_01605 [Verrucomicrobiota bacterium]